MDVFFIGRGAAALLSRGFPPVRRAIPAKSKRNVISKLSVICPLSHGAADESVLQSPQ
jgi:hypothetical protein